MTTNYTTLVGAKATQGSIKSWVRYSEIDPDTILEDAQNYIYQRLRVRQMRRFATGLTIAAGDESVALPSDFLDPIEFTIRYPQQRLTLRSEKTLQLEYRTFDENSALIEGLPQNYAIMTEAFDDPDNPVDSIDTAYFDVAAEDAYTYDLLYFRRPTVLSSTNETNFLTTRYSMILRHCCIGFAAMSFKDAEEAGVSLKMADAMMDNAREMDDLSRRGQEA